MLILTLPLTWSSTDRKDSYTNSAATPWLLDVLLTTTVGDSFVNQPIPETLAHTSLLVLRSVLQSLRVPAFDAGQVISVESLPVRDGLQGCRVLARVPQVDHLPIEVYQGAARFAAQWTPRLLQMPPTPESLALWATAVEQEVVRPLQSRVPGGLSTFQVLRAAHALGVPFMHLGGGVYQLGWGQAQQRLDRSAILADSAMGARMAQDKAVTATALGMAGLPVPDHVLVRTQAQAQAAARRLGWPVVVKPADRDRGEGVRCDVDSDAALAQAFSVALQASKTGRLLVEKQVPGLCHRLFVAHGQLLYAVKRWPRSVWGDGQQSVDALLQALQAPQARWPLWQREPDIPRDQTLTDVLQSQGLTLHSVPARGQRVLVRPFESTAWGGSDEDVSERLHPDNRELALRATRLLGLSVAGVDLMCEDITVPWHRSGAVINEVNHAPLLGGAAISRQYLEPYVRGLMRGGDGRIPVEVFEGPLSDSLARAHGRMQALAAEGVSVWLTTATHTWRADIQQAEPVAVPLAVQGLVARTRALLMEPQVGHLLLWVPDAQTLQAARQAGLPVDRFT